LFHQSDGLDPPAQLHGLDRAVNGHYVSRVAHGNPLHDGHIQHGMPQEKEESSRFGIDIRSRKFREDSLAVIGQKIKRYCAL